MPEGKFAELSVTRFVPEKLGRLRKVTVLPETNLAEESVTLKASMVWGPRSVKVAEALVTVKESIFRFR